MIDYSTYTEDIFQSDLHIARSYLNKYSTNYSFATKLFRKRVKNDTIIFYAFLRYVDEFVDNPAKGQTQTQIQETINQIKKEWQDIVNLKIDTKNQNSILRATHQLFMRNKIPFSYADSFFNAMEQDIKKSRYANYDELERYMYGSAAVVGLAMTHIVSYSNNEALHYAKRYGEAMQLTNFVRDINEDLIKRDRIYIPQEYLIRFGVSEQMLYDKVMNDNIKNLVIFLISKSRELLNEGRTGIPMLGFNYRYAVRLAGNIYEYNLNILEKRNYDIFQRPIRISTMRKIIIALNTKI